VVRWRLVFADSGYNYIRKSVDFRRLVGFILEISISVGYVTLRQLQDFISVTFPLHLRAFRASSGHRSGLSLCSRGACVGGVVQGRSPLAGVSRWCEVRVRVWGGCARATQIASASDGSSSRTVADRVRGMSLASCVSGASRRVSLVGGGGARGGYDVGSEGEFGIGVGLGTDWARVGRRLDSSWVQVGLEMGASRERVGSELGASWERVGSESGASRVRCAAAAFAAFAVVRVASRFHGFAVELGLFRGSSWASFEGRESRKALASAPGA
jgi:hypothetical protein